jgi:carbohydrate-selective porin OprB
MEPQRRLRRLASAPAPLVLSAGTASGQAPTEATPGHSATPSIAASLGVVGNLCGFRDQLDAKGISFSLTYTGEALTKVSSGLCRFGTFADQRIGTDGLSLAAPQAMVRHDATGATAASTRLSTS